MYSIHWLALQTEAHTVLYQTRVKLNPSLWTLPPWLWAVFEEHQPVWETVRWVWRAQRGSAPLTHRVTSLPTLNISRTLPSQIFVYLYCCCIICCFIILFICLVCFPCQLLCCMETPVYRIHYVVFVTQGQLFLSALIVFCDYYITGLNLNWGEMFYFPIIHNKSV